MQPVLGQEENVDFISNVFLSVHLHGSVCLKAAGERLSPPHGLQDGLRQVVRGHHDVSGAVGAAPGEDGMDVVRGFPLLQRPVPQINEELQIREAHLHSQDTPTLQVSSHGAL